MKIFLFLLLIACCLQGKLAAQGGFLMNGGVQVVCSGNPQIVIENGKWKNTASTLTPANSTVKFTGTATTLNSTVEGNTTFNNLSLSKSTNDMLLTATTTTINNRVVFSSGNLNLGNKTLSLGASAVLFNEAENSRTYSALANSRVLRTANVNNPASLNFGNMGMVFTLVGNLGSTTLDRRHAVQVIPSGNSIQKHWRVTAATPAGWNATLRFYYFDAELNGLNEANLTIWRSTNNGVTWTDMGFSSRNTTSNFVQQTAIADVSGWWTLGEVPPGPIVGNGDNRNESAPETLEANPAMTSWSLYPNPATAHSTLAINIAQEKEVMLRIFDTNGKLVLTHRPPLHQGANWVQLDLNALSKGTYFIHAEALGLPALPFIKI